MINKLSIYIPTYNREKRLLQLLKSIEQINSDFLEEVIISDNCSKYDVENSVRSNLSEVFFDKIRIIKNPVNIAAPGNIRNAFYWCRTKWMWLIGDDDEVLPDSLKIIETDVLEDPNCAQFRYSCLVNSDSEFKEDDMKLSSLNDFIDYYNNEAHTKENFAFMSNNVFNMELIAPFIMYTFIFSTSLTHIIPFLKGLDERAIYIRYRGDKIIRYLMPEVGTEWNKMRVMLAISTVSHIPFKSLNIKSKKRLLQICSLVRFDILISHMTKNKDKGYDYIMLSEVYNGLYRYTEPWYRRVLYYFFKIELLTSIPVCSLPINFIRAFLNRK